MVRVPEIVDDDGIEPGSAQIAVLDSRTGTRIHSLLAQEAWPEAAGIDDQRGRAVAVVSGAVLVYDISCLKSYYILGDLG